MTILVSVVMLMVLFAPAQLVMAQNATAETWTSAIVYFNTSGDTGSMDLTFYDGATSYPAASMAVNGHQNGTILVGSISTTPSMPSSFKGSAVLSASVPLAVVHYDYSQGNPDTYDRAFYSAFDLSQANNEIYITTVEKTAHSQVTTSRVGVQNVETSASANVTLHFINVGETTAFFTKAQTIAPSASYVFSLLDADFSTIPNNWSGSLKITTSPSALILAAAEQTAGARRYAYSFEGVKSGEYTINVPTMLCHYGSEDQTSYIAIQANGGDANVTVKHYDKFTGLQIGSTYGPVSVPNGSKEVVNPCIKGAVPYGAVGSSIITAAVFPVNVSVKVNGTTGLRTAYIAQGTGTETVALPYVSYHNDKYTDFRTYISVMNVDTVDGENIVATYYNEDGTVKTTHTLATGTTKLGPLQKVNTQLGLLGGGNWKGAVMITSDVDIFVSARSHKGFTGLEANAAQMGEDYTGIPVTTP
ncbi:hypothetical protein ACFLUA_01195 [Chloroflexota bacterium]